MNLFVLLLLLFVFSVFAIVLSNGDIMSPLSLSYVSFLVVTIIAFSYNGFSGRRISGITVIFILLNLVIFSSGYLIVVAMERSKNKKWEVIEKKDMPNLGLTIIFLVVETIGFLAYLRFSLRSARGISSRAMIMNMLYYIRNAQLFSDYSIGFGLTIISFFCIALGYFYTYVLIRNLIWEKKNTTKETVCYVWIVLISLLTSMLGTGRTFLIKYMVVSFFFYYYLKVSRQRGKVIGIRQFFKIARSLIVLAVVFFGLFQLMGITTGKTGQATVKDMIYIYSGSSIIALDQAIAAYQNDARFFGEESFYGLYGFLNHLGFNIPNNILHLPFVNVGDGIRTNIYTSLRTYLYDFGFLGTSIVQFFIGIVAGVMYCLLNKFGYNLVYLFVYGIFLYGLVMQGIAETLLRNFMSVTNVFLVLFVWLFYKGFKKKIVFKL